MKKQTLVWIGIYAVVGYAAYMYFKPSKKKNIDTIISTGNYSSAPSNLEGFGEDFLKSWAKAAKKNEPAFVFQGKVYNTNGGRIKA